MFMCYTSGTTGNAKGVMLTHNNLLHDIESFSERMGTLDRSTMMISYLPYPHVFEQCLMAASIRFGGRIGYFSGHPKDLTDDCAVLKPTVFTSVPRLYNKIHAAISAKMEITK
jgi:long-chain acyl-CoA synthetase